MSHHDSVLMFTNTSRTACQIQGYPGLAVLNAAGTQIKQAPRPAAPPRWLTSWRATAPRL